MNPIERKQAIAGLKARIKILNGELELITSQCKHEELEFGIEKLTAVCKICGTRFFWYCPTSPTLTCDYLHDDGHYDPDDCKYCHQPEERK